MSFGDFIVMSIIISIALLFLGIGALVLIHICVVHRAYRSEFRDNGNDIRNRTSLGSTSMSRDDLEKLPCFAFKAKDQGSSSPGDCAVCLDKFKAGEKCRLLPSCRHSFHAECVDIWLMRTPVCPICRARADNLAAMGLSGEVENSGDQDFVSIEFTDSIDFPAQDSTTELSGLQENAQLSQENKVRESETMPAGRERPTAETDREGDAESEAEGEHAGVLSNTT